MRWSARIGPWFREDEMKIENGRPLAFERAATVGRITTEETLSEPEFSLRPARPRDYSFALALFLEGSVGLLRNIGRWDEARVVSKFKRAYKQEQARIICIDGEDVGWIQVVELARRLHLRQIHLIARVRGRRIGTQLIKGLHV